MEEVRELLEAKGGAFDKLVSSLFSLSSLIASFFPSDDGGRLVESLLEGLSRCGRGFAEVRSRPEQLLEAFMDSL